MTFEWKTKKINISTYYKAIRRCIIINGHDGTRGSGYRAWTQFKKQWKIVVVPTSETEKYMQFIKHLKLEGSGGMAWGVTGKNELYWFVNDSRNPFVFRSNLPPGFHELLHALYQQVIGTGHVQYLTSDPPEVNPNRTVSGPAATVIVHDNWYGFKTKITTWFSNGSWLPVKMPYIPIWKAKEMYDIIN